MIITVGKSYRTRSGDKVTITKKTNWSGCMAYMGIHHRTEPVKGTIHRSWSETGLHSGAPDNPLDLVAEWQETLSLELTLEEALVVYLLSGSVVGSPESTLRKLSDSLFYHLIERLGHEKCTAIDQSPSLKSGIIEALPGSLAVIENLANPKDKPTELTVSEIAKRLGIAELKIVKG